MEMTESAASEPNPIASERAAPGLTRSETMSIVSIVAIALLLCAGHWVKLEKLDSRDPTLWLSQVARFAAGQWPYLDFSWNYPPLSLFILGGVAKLFGATFGVMQVSIDLLGIVIVLLSFAIVRYFLPPSLQFVSIFGLMAVCATALTKFSLFSFSTYSPSLQVATIGLLMMMLGGVRRIRYRQRTFPDTLLLSGGLFICLTTKPEAALAGLALALLVAILDRPERFDRESIQRWLLSDLAPAGVAGALSLIVYVAVAQKVGWEAMKLGITGYGLASFACPWWPTGLGVFGAMGATGEAVAMAALSLLPAYPLLSESRKKTFRCLALAAIPGALLFAAYAGYLSHDVLASGAPLFTKLKGIAPAIIWTSPVLLPVMWASILLFCYLCLKMARLGLADRELCILLCAPVVMSVRSLFGTTLFPFTEVSALCYPFFLIVAPALIWRLYAAMGATRSKAAIWAVASVIGAYGLLRLGAAYPEQFSTSHEETLHSEAGDLRLSDNGISAEIYRYVVEHTGPSDMVLDLPYGGGYNFAARRPSPVFQTQFRQLKIPVKYEQADLMRLLANKPKVVIAWDQPNFGMLFGHDANMNCTFPELVWAPYEPSWDPAHLFPVLQYVKDHYRVDRKIGQYLVLIPKS